MSLLPEVERELLRVARSPMPEVRAQLGVRGTWWRSTFAGVLTAGLAVASVAVTVLLLVLLGHATVRQPGHRLEGVGSGQFPGAPHTQPGRWPAGFPCPLAPPNRYLPARAGCLSVRRADVDGDGRRDLILLYANLSRRGVEGGFPDFALKVVSATGVTFTTQVRPFNVNPTIIRVRNVNNRPGVEILIHDGHLSSGESAGVYTFDGHRVRRAGRFTYGGDSAARSGFICRVGHPATITQYSFLLEQGPIQTGRWQRTVSTFEWRGSELRRTAMSTTVNRGVPPEGLQGVHC